jgi:hypothetical protein
MYVSAATYIAEIFVATETYICVAFSRYTCQEMDCPDPDFRGTDSNARYLQHQAKHHGGDPLICPDCDQVISYDNEARHRKTCRERGLLKKEQQALF